MRINSATRGTGPVTLTHEGAPADRTTAYNTLRRTVLTCMLWEPTFYESGSTTAQRIAELVPQVDPILVSALAVEAREKMQLRHVPLYLVRQLARVPKQGSLVADTLNRVIQRADELSEFCAMWFAEQPKGAKLSHRGVKRGLAEAFGKFNEYSLAKYDRASKVRLRDVLFLCHAKPKDAAQTDLWKRLVSNQLTTPDTWETELSAGKDKRATFERLLREGKLGGMALLRNLRNMIGANVDESLIRDRLEKGVARALPFRFVTAARYAPHMEDSLERTMFAALGDVPSLPGTTGLLIDVSGSMEAPVSLKSETTRIDAAAGLAILLREKAQSARVATFSNDVVEVPNRRGFALRDAVNQSQHHGGTYLAKAITSLRTKWQDIDRLIIITDEQSQDGISAPWAKRNYLINVASYANGVSHNRNWCHIDGWSEAVLQYIIAAESEEAEGSFSAR